MSKTDWFATWFDTSYYHILYQKRNDEEARRFITNLVGFLQHNEGDKVLDLACGMGRHSKTLHQLGLNVLGVDLSSNSIESAKESEEEGLRFAVQDMREPLDEKFNAIYNLFTSFGYFDDISDNDKVIASMGKMLHKNGMLIIDFMNSERVINELVTKETKVLSNIEFNLTRRYDGKHIFKDIKFCDEGRNYHFTERVQALKLNDFESLLTKNGFEIKETFGDFNLEPFRPEKSDRLIIIAKKIK